jgi:hypothetical protein
MSKYETPPDFLAFIPHAIKPQWDNDWAPRLAGFPINIVYAARIEGVGLAQATYVFDPSTFVDGEQSKQVRYRPTIDSDFSVLVVLHREGRIELTLCERRILTLSHSASWGAPKEARFALSA